jgi:molybdopterin/thiamine biosynthesis adenylyltransferase
MIMELDHKEIERYKKHLMLPEIGEAGQRKMKSSSVLVVGGGGLGSPVAMYLAAAGIGRIGLVDGDVVDLSNLQRQVLHTTRSIGKKKVVSGKDMIRALNPEVRVETYPENLSELNASAFFQSYDLIIDCTDNLDSRYLINLNCVAQHKPFIHGAVYKFEGQVSVFDTDHGPCYQCVFPVKPDPGQYPLPAQIGLLNTLPGIIGTLQATEAIKMILQIGTPLVGKLLIVDALESSFRVVNLIRRIDCPICGGKSRS